MSESNYVFKPKYHKGVPADGFSHFTKCIWEKIVTSKELDLPTQQQLLAQFRCEEIAKVSFFNLECLKKRERFCN